MSVSAQPAFPAGTPLRLSAEVAGSLSQLQGLFQASEPQLENASAMHWLAYRQAGWVPAFQEFTRHMVWGTYGTIALKGLLRQALSGRATPEVVSGIIDQLNLIQTSFAGAGRSLGEFLQLPEARDFDAVPAMVQSLQPLDRVWRAMQLPQSRIMTGIRWVPTAQAPTVPIRLAQIERPGGADILP